MSLIVFFISSFFGRIVWTCIPTEGCLVKNLVIQSTRPLSWGHHYVTTGVHNTPGQGRQACHGDDSQPATRGRQRPSSWEMPGKALMLFHLIWRLRGGCTVLDTTAWLALALLHSACPAWRTLVAHRDFETGAVSKITKEYQLSFFFFWLSCVPGLTSPCLCPAARKTSEVDSRTFHHPDELCWLCGLPRSKVHVVWLQVPRGSTLGLFWHPWVVFLWLLCSWIGTKPL